MKVKFYLAMAAAAFLMTNCSQDENMIQTKGSTNTLTAAIESASRSTVSDGGVFAWDENDAIAVGNADGDYTKFVYGNETFTAETAIVPTGYAIYPYNEAYQSLPEGTALPTITLPNGYAYGSTNAPMLATISEGVNSLTFNHLAGLMRFRVKGIQNATEFSLTADKDITGSFTPGTDNEGKTCINAGTTGTNNKVTITFTTVEDVMDFYVPMPVGEYTSLTVKIGEKTLASTDGVTNKIARGKLLLMPTMVFDDNGDLKLEGGNNVSLNANEEVSLEVNDGEEVVVEMVEGATATLNLTAPENSSEGLSISDGSAEGTESSQTSVGTLNVSATNASSLNINTPTLTVNLESGTYNDVTALTAQNTLMIGKGVSVGTLKIKGGHVRLGGEITTVTREEGNEDEVTYIILEDDVAAPTNLPENVKAVTAAEYDLIVKFNAGGTQTITLTDNVKLMQPLTLNNENANITIDLGTYSLTNETAYDYDNCGETECYVFEVKAGTLNITGTTGSVNAIGGADYDMAVFANDNGKVNISGGKFTNSGKENDGCDLIYVRDNATVTISGGEFEAGNKSSDVSNQYVALNLRDADRSTASITVTGGKFHNFNPANNLSEGENTTFVAEGYSSNTSDEGKTYVVSKD